MKKMIMTIE